jgi:hypothetical protein
MGRKFEISSDVDINDVLSNLEVKDVIDWIDGHAMDYEKEKLRLHLTVHYKIPFATHEETLVDVMKSEAIERIWNEITLEDIENLTNR